MWVWGDCSPSAIIDCQVVPPPLNPFLADVPGIQGLDGSEMLEVDRAMMRELPYSEPPQRAALTIMVKIFRGPPLGRMLRSSSCTSTLLGSLY